MADENNVNELDNNEVNADQINADQAQEQENKKPDIAEQLKRQRPVVSKSLSWLDEDDDGKEADQVANAPAKEVEDPMADLRSTILKDKKKQEAAQKSPQKPKPQDLSSEDRERLIAQRNNVLAMEHEEITDKEMEILSSESSVKPLTKEETKQLDAIVAQAKKDEPEKETDIARSHRNIPIKPLPDVELDEDEPVENDVKVEEPKQEEPVILEQPKKQRTVISKSLSWLDEDDDGKEADQVANAPAKEVEDPMADLRAAVINDKKKQESEQNKQNNTQRNPNSQGLSPEDRERFIAQMDNVLALEHEEITDKEMAILSSKSTVKPLTKEETKRLDAIVAQAIEDKIEEETDIALSRRNIPLKPLPDVEFDEDEPVENNVKIEEPKQEEPVQPLQSTSFKRFLYSDDDELQAQDNTTNDVLEDKKDVLEEKNDVIENKSDNKKNPISDAKKGEANVAFFNSKLASFNRMYKLEANANDFASHISDAWEKLKSGDEIDKGNGRKMLAGIFKSTVRSVFESEKSAAYNEQRLPEFNDALKSTNELFRAAMYAFTDLYHNPKSESLFGATAFGGLNFSDLTDIAVEDSLWKMDQKSDKAWEIQSGGAKDLTEQWLKEDKPYEKMISEMNGLIESTKKGTPDRQEMYTKLAAAEWLLVNNEKMMIEDPEDPINPVPNWGNRYWKAITAAREAIGIPKHTSMRELIQSNYAEMAKAVVSARYNETQIQNHVMSDDARKKHDSFEKQKEQFAIQSASVIVNNLQDNKSNEKSEEAKEDYIRKREPVESENEREKQKNEPRVWSNMVVDNQKELKINSVREDFR